MAARAVVRWLLLSLGGLSGGCAAEGSDPCPLDEPSCAISFESLLDLKGIHEDHTALLEPYLISSFDRNGGNLDFGLVAPGSSVLYVDDRGRNVLFDERGPGVLSRIWLTHFQVETALDQGAESLSVLAGDISFTFDDEPEPRIHLSLRDFFGGAVAPFVEPFVGDPDTSAGGYVAYVPMPFAERLVVSSDMVIPYVQLGAYRVAGPVRSFDPAALDSGAVERARAAWLAADVIDREAELPISSTVSLAVPALGSASVQAEPGPGVLHGARFVVTPEPSFRPELQLRIVVDGEPVAEMGWGDFFLVPLEQVEVPARLVGRHADGHYFVYFPMPYESALAMEITDTGGTAVGVEATLIRQPQPVAGLLRFHAHYHEAALEPADPDYSLLSVSGSGHLAGTSMTMCCRGGAEACSYLGNDHFGYLEGDDKMYLGNGAEAPLLHGTGAEDYFNSGFYYLKGRTYGRPSHGMPYLQAGPLESLAEGAFDCTTQYRLHLSDPVPFREHLRFDLEHGPESNFPAWFNSVAFYYLRPPP